MSFQQPEKMETNCPECGTKNEVLYFPSNRNKVEVPGARAGRSISWSGRGEKVEGKCIKCNYKFTEDDI